MKTFLVRALAIVFTFQGMILLIAAYKCESPAMCPDLGDRTEKLFSIATATVLSLLTKEP